MSAWVGFDSEGVSDAIDCKTSKMRQMVGAYRLLIRQRQQTKTGSVVPCRRRDKVVYGI
jgi:hypothetical protein